MLNHPLTDAQVKAASRVHARLGQWKAIDAALARLRKACPRWDPEAALLKSAAVDRLYSTNVHVSLEQIARHVSAVMRRGLDGAALVERIAEIENRKGEIQHLRSFASKLCHFFVDQEAYPIFDNYVGLTLRHHLGGKRFPFHRNANPEYDKVLQALEDPRTLASLKSTSRELDRYLWLSGLYREWQRKKDAKINVEVSEMFRTAGPRLEVDLTKMVGGK